MKNWSDIATALQGTFAPWEVDAWLTPIQQSLVDPDSLTAVAGIQPTLTTIEGRQAALTNARVDWWESEGVSPAYIRFLDAEVTNNGEDEPTAAKSEFGDYLAAVRQLDKPAIFSAWCRAWMDGVSASDLDLPANFPFDVSQAEKAYGLWPEDAEQSSLRSQLAVYLFGAYEGVIPEVIKAYDPNQPRYPKGHPLAGQWMPKNGEGDPGLRAEAAAHAAAKPVADIANGKVKLKTLTLNDGRTKADFRTVELEDAQYSKGPASLLPVDPESSKRPTAKPFEEAHAEITAFSNNFAQSYKGQPYGSWFLDYESSQRELTDLANLADELQTKYRRRSMQSANDPNPMYDEFDNTDEYMDSVVRPLKEFLAKNPVPSSGVYQYPVLDPATGYVTYQQVAPPSAMAKGKSDWLWDLSKIPESEPDGKPLNAAAQRAIKHSREMEAMVYRAQIQVFLKNMKTAAENSRNINFDFESNLHGKIASAVNHAVPGTDRTNVMGWMEGIQLKYTMDGMPLEAPKGTDPALVQPLLMGYSTYKLLDDKANSYYSDANMLVEAGAKERKQVAKRIAGIHKRFGQLVSDDTLAMGKLMDMTGYDRKDLLLLNAPSQAIYKHEGDQWPKALVDNGQTATPWMMNKKFVQQVDVSYPDDQSYGRPPLPLVKTGLVINIGDYIEYDKKQDELVPFRAFHLSYWKENHWYGGADSPEYKAWRDSHPKYLDATLSLGPNVDIGTYAHEYGHLLEAMHPNLHIAAVDFLKRRTANDHVEKLSDVTGSKYYGDHEITRKDKFHNPYIGKVYINADTKVVRATEVVSMGVEAMFTSPAYMLRQDPELFDLSLRVMLGDPKLLGGDMQDLESDKVKWHNYDS